MKTTKVTLKIADLEKILKFAKAELQQNENVVDTVEIVQEAYNVRHNESNDVAAFLQTNEMKLFLVYQNF